jgi:hypothetical protein
MTAADPPEQLPRIKRAKPRSPAKSAFSDATVSGLGSVLSAASRAVDLVPHDRIALLTFLHVRLHTADAARTRAKWIGGRLYNRLSGEDADYVPLSGTHLRQTLAVIGIDAPGAIAAAGGYLLRSDLVREARDILAREFET